MHAKSFLTSIQRRIYKRKIPKQHQGTVCFFSSLSYFLTLNNSLTLIVLASGKEAWQIWRLFLLLVRWVYLPSILSQVLWTSYSSAPNKGPIHIRATKRVWNMVHKQTGVRAFRLPLCLLLSRQSRSSTIKDSLSKGRTYLKGGLCGIVPWNKIATKKISFLTLDASALPLNNSKVYLYFLRCPDRHLPILFSYECSCELFPLWNRTHSPGRFTGYFPFSQGVP